MPRSRSRSIESSTCSSISRSERPPQSWIKRSASVDLPWSMCAMMEKFLMWSISGERFRYGNEKGHAGCPFSIKRTANFSRTRPLGGAQRCGESLPIEEVMADLDAILDEHRHQFVVARLER